MDMINQYVSLLNQQIEKIENQTADKKYSANNAYPVFIVGAPRTGTTLIYQYLISKYDVDYPSNLIAKFWNNPLVGYSLQKSLCPANNYVSNFKSYHGYSENSFLEPHEFGYFWSKWFDHTTSHHTNKSANVDKKLSGTISALLELSKKTWLFKNLTISLKIPLIKSIFPNSKFIIVYRDPLNTAVSLLKGRIIRFRDKSVWWSLKPKEIKDILTLCPEEQVIAQVFYTYMQIVKDIKSLDPLDKTIVKYEDFCNNPNMLTKEKLKHFGLRTKLDLGQTFQNESENTLGDKTTDKMLLYYNNYDFNILNELE